ncbi:unnamed protein product [Gongylonema pulchrum]|uniref:PHD-type domain-containing protein n=1 Tax=Gongylonema pulchrum TaxID=637853 RepID=A0A183E9Y3_9BILA|nr:unnamed protein product [Gongylonema pulchrum]
MHSGSAKALTKCITLLRFGWIFVDLGDDSSNASQPSDESSESDSASVSSGGSNSENVVETKSSRSAKTESKNEAATKKGQLICTLCLNQRVSVRQDEVIQCAKCQIAFHEKCYVPETLTDEGSGGSNTSSAQFFCEPCLYGLKEPPYCELCPNRYGAFKRADIGGGWVHLLCALYTPGVTFSDLNRLTGVSWQEIDYKSFGKRICVACSDPLQTRTGIAVQCDAGLCKNHFHVTCAQRLGLLADHAEGTADPELTDSATSAKKFDECDVEAEERRYLNCKRHADKEAMCLGSVR